jgi:hypothetical protein
VFKIFVANPKNVESVVAIFTRNKARIIKLLENFLPDRSPIKKIMNFLQPQQKL